MWNDVSCENVANTQGHDSDKIQSAVDEFMQFMGQVWYLNIHIL